LPVLALAVALFAGLLVSAPSASAVTSLTSAMDACLRSAATNPGGMLIFVDERMYTTQVLPLRQRLWANGRPACVRHDFNLNVARAYAWWHGLPASRKPPYVIVAAPGTPTQWHTWLPDLPKKRLLGTPDSQVTPGSMLTWKTHSTGATEGAVILQRYREYTIYGGPWAGTSESYRILSNAAMCKLARTSPKGVYVFGDSITTRDFNGVYNALRARGYIPCIDGQWGSRVYEHLRRLQAGKIVLPKNVIIALGNNDVFSAGRFRIDAWRMLALIGTTHNVIFPTVWRNKPGTYLRADQYNARAMNIVIHDMLWRQPHWRVMEWAAVVQAHPAYQSDGIHLSTSGKVKRYDMYADLLDQLT
jgi:lysophospholipase L1-like esterase